MVMVVSWLCLPDRERRSLRYNPSGDIPGGISSVKTNMALLFSGAVTSMLLDRNFPCAKVPCRAEFPICSNDVFDYEFIQFFWCLTRQVHRLKTGSQ